MLKLAIGPVVASLVLALSLAISIQPASGQKKAPEGARILLLSGGQRQHHGYREQAFYLASLLEDTGRFEVTINEDAALLETPAFSKYDALIVMADRRDPEFSFSDSQQKAIFDFVKAGGGYISVHGADNAPTNWLPEWRTMLGGLYSHDTSGGRPDGKTKKAVFPIHVVNSSHPITEGLEDFSLQDELYYNIQMEPGVEPLLTARYLDKDWPVAWVSQFGQGRVFHCALGHRDFGPDKSDPLRDPNLARLVLQGASWVSEPPRQARLK